MAIQSLLSQRSRARHAEATRQVIAFRLRQEWFALPIETVQKVVPLGKIYGDPQQTGISLTIYQGQELLVVDVGRRIFSETPHSAHTLGLNASQHPAQSYLLVVQIPSGSLIGLPIDSQPALQRVPKSAFTPLPVYYLSAANLRCVTALMIQTPDQPPLFLLDPERLGQPQQIGPAPLPTSQASTRLIAEK